VCLQKSEGWLAGWLRSWRGLGTYIWAFCVIWDRREGLSLVVYGVRRIDSRLREEVFDIR